MGQLIVGLQNTAIFDQYYQVYLTGMPHTQIYTMLQGTFGDLNVSSNERKKTERTILNRERSGELVYL